MRWISYSSVHCRRSGPTARRYVGSTWAAPLPFLAAAYMVFAATPPRAWRCWSRVCGGSGSRMHERIVLSYLQAQPLLDAQRAGQIITRVSPNLGLSSVEVTLTTDGVVFPDDRQLSW